MIDRCSPRLVVGELRNPGVVHATTLSVCTADAIQRSQPWISLGHGNEVGSCSRTPRRTSLAVIETHWLLQVQSVIHLISDLKTQVSCDFALYPDVCLNGVVLFVARIQFKQDSSRGAGSSGSSQAVNLSFGQDAKR